MLLNLAFSTYGNTSVQATLAASLSEVTVTVIATLRFLSEKHKASIICECM